MDPQSKTIRKAYAECRNLARRHYENFPTASLLVPPEYRDALAAIYAFARYADDIADEPGVEGRLKKLAAWRQKLDECYAGVRLVRDPTDDYEEHPYGAPRVDHPVFIALGDAAERWQLSQIHFQNLLRAFEQDVTVNRHKDFASLLAYCTCSANPVGRLVLELYGHRDYFLFEHSDSICTALQLANFWQDVEIDLSRDRIYLPLDDMAQFDYSLDDLRARRADERWRKLMASEIALTRGLFQKGLALTDLVRPDLRLQLRLTWLGGMAILKKIEAVEYDVFRRRPKLGKWDFVSLYLRARIDLWQAEMTQAGRRHGH